ncbi:hypothetical protein [Arenimonas oryziterrae]|uniref:Outer membrane protein beta-barrel domain-containing protein n=1 Tax=Arenimonas oryziterrae DSM 21050 = YC6267 TaxID=1121015 RepID=A0A091APU6_9GAMM|nr:hypothetical protein [Arenimonas oryziterrae]KFN40989.1 hypothetical protein N789_03665 [Arenimonas oryziterrae DSM 21050 = YC6267]
MKKSPLALGLGLCLLAPAAFASTPTFYANLEFGHANHVSGGEYNYEAVVTPPTFQNAAPSDFDSADSRGLRIGAHFSNPLFIELNVSHGEAEGREPTLVGAPAAPCFASLNMFGPICSTRSDFKSEYISHNVDLIAGWDFKLSEASTISPYIGARRIKFQDRRVGRDMLAAGPGIAYDTEIKTNFDHIGWVVGGRYNLEFAQTWFFRGELQQAHASGDRHRTAVLELPGFAPPGTFFGVRPDDSIGVTQRMARVEVGKRFLFGGQKATLSLGYQDQRHGGLDTRQINTLNIGPSIGYGIGLGGSGDRNENVSMRGFYLNFGINQ